MKYAKSIRIVDYGSKGLHEWINSQENPSHGHLSLLFENINTKA